MQEGDRRQLDRVVALVSDVLGRNVVGAYLFGSAVDGGLRLRSDLDVLVVSERALSPEEKRKLVDRILPIS
jgi:aminoglycoside 9-adenylyltransferase